MKLPRAIGDYVFVPSGEAVRAFEVGAVIVVLQLVSQVGTVTDWRDWARGGIGALATFAIGFIKGRVGAPTR